jgi:opacity protein-like surface antigen
LSENTKRYPLAVCVLLVFVCTPLSKAQTPGNDQFPKIEIFGGYSSIETNNHNFHFGLPSRGFNAGDTDFDEGGTGFEAAVIRNLNRYVGIMGDFSAHFSYDQGPVALTPPCAQPPCAPVTQIAELNPRLFNFLAGPEFKWRNHTRFTPFAHALFGVAHTTATFSTAGPAVSLSKGDEDTGFAMTYGGGFQVRILRRVSFRASLDYSKAFVGSSALPPQRVDSLGYSAGVVFHFH